ncbi:unnamed protein product [Durusdinium trenchii]|uniref:Uncharacterized protein n=1 Tax=Durusdinium trenchii TaxID=1381693 RepID=A0ABP0NKW0_9DINO
MGKPRNSGKGATKGRKGGKAPDPGQRLPKFLLAPYVDDVGCPFYCRGQEEDQVLKPSTIAAGATSQNSEWASRLGIALSEASGVAEMGAATMEELFGEAVDINKMLSAMGVVELQKLLDSSEGAKYLAACTHLNKLNEAERDDDSVKEAVAAWLAWWTEDAAKKAKAFRKLARVAGRLYLWSVDSLEQLAFAGHPVAYAKAMKAAITEESLEAVKRWQKDPQSEGKLLKALRATYDAQVQGKKKRKTRRGLAEESGSASHAAAAANTQGSTTGTGSTDSSSGSEPDQAKRRRTAPSPLESLPDESGGSVAEAQAAQETALAGWQLSEIQSSSEAWAEFAAALRAKTATEEAFKTHLALLPVSVRAAFNLKLSKMPKGEIVEKLLTRIELIHATGLSFWKAQQEGRAGE